jgi:hypothetical protein
MFHARPVGLPSEQHNMPLVPASRPEGRIGLVPATGLLLLMHSLFTMRAQGDFSKGNSLGELNFPTK